jgi:hypothetical protein
MRARWARGRDLGPRTQEPTVLVGSLFRERPPVARFGALDDAQTVVEISVHSSARAR